MVYDAVVAPVPEATEVQTFPSVDCCHWIAPVWPVKLIVVLAPAAKRLFGTDAVPPVEGAWIAIATVVLTAELQEPLATTAL